MRGKRSRHSPSLTCLLIAGAAVLTAGCAVRDVEDTLGGWFDSPTPGPALGAAMLPHYHVGDSFSYDNGRVETVVAVDGDRVSWKNDRGFAFTAYYNPILPRLTWESKKRKGKLEDLTAAPSTLWPLEVGKETKFSYSSTVVEKETGTRKAYGYTFDCRVTDTRAVTVPAGTFDTYRINCYRNQRISGRYFGARSWYYAPAIGHFVLREDVYRSKNRQSRRVALQSVLPSLAGLGANGRSRLDSAVQGALEKLTSGKAKAWESGDGAYRGSVTPLRTFKTSKGLFCRDYRVTVTAHGRTGSYDRTACRSAEGAWEPV